MLLNESKRILNEGAWLLNEGTRLLKEGVRLLNKGAGLLNEVTGLFNEGNLHKMAMEAIYPKKTAPFNSNKGWAVTGAIVKDDGKTNFKNSSPGKPSKLSY